MLLFALPIKVDAKPNVSARNAILMEQSTGRVLFEKAANDPNLIASITKIMTAIIAIESGKLDTDATISHRSVYTEGSSVYLEEGEKMKLEDLVYGLMLRSGNDAAVAIAEHVGGSVEGFVHLMNEKAAWLGMTSSHFDNPHGLDSDTHYSTAYDMALLMRYAMENDVFKEVTGAKSHKAETREYAWGNKNRLLTQYYEYCTGGKTGYTKAAGRSLVTTAEKDGMQLIVVTIDGPDDWNDHMRLFDWGFEQFDMEKIEEKGKETYNINNSEVFINGFVRENLSIPLAEDELYKMEVSTYISPEALEEKDGDVIGKKLYKLDGNIVAETAIYSDEREEPHFLQSVLTMFHRLTGVL